jgi:type VI secretion system protein ImpH
VKELAAEAWRYSFFQAVLLLERLLGRVPLGRDGPAAEELVRIRPSISLACPPRDIEAIEQRDDGRVQITTTLLGLYGIDSPLPYAYAEELAREADEPSGQRVRDFLDVFHHRLYSLLYRAWRKTRPVTGASDPIYERVLALVGRAPQLGLGSDHPPPLWELRMRVLRPRTAVGLEAMLRYRLGYDCHVTQLEPRTVVIPPDQRARLGSETARLGSTLVVGARITDSNKIALRIEAESFAMFEELLPGGYDRRRLEQVMRSYLREPIAYDVVVGLAPEHVPPWPLGQRGALGHSVWLGRPRSRAVYRAQCPPLM